MSKIRIAKYQIGQVVRHRIYPFRGVVFDIDPSFDNTDEWYEFDPGRNPAAQGSAVLSFVCRERRDRIRRLRVRAKSVAGYDRRAGAASASRRGLRQRRQGRLSPAHSLGALTKQAVTLRKRERPGCDVHGRGAFLSQRQTDRSDRTLHAAIAAAERQPAACRPAVARASCAPRRRGAAVLPAASSVAPRRPSDRSAGRHRPCRNRPAAKRG